MNSTTALYIGNGLVFQAGELTRADLLVEAGRISRIGEFPAPPGAEVLDASGLAVLPGGIDNHVHFREPGMAEKEGYDAGTRAALHGGVFTARPMCKTAPARSGASGVAIVNARVRVVCVLTGREGRPE